MTPDEQYHKLVIEYGRCAFRPERRQEIRRDLKRLFVQMHGEEPPYKAQAMFEKEMGRW